MAENSANKASITFDLSLDQYDLLIESVSKANALVNVILSVSDLEQIPNPTLHNYFGTLNDLINDIGNSCHRLRQSQPKANSEVI